MLRDCSPSPRHQPRLEHTLHFAAVVTYRPDVNTGERSDVRVGRDSHHCISKGGELLTFIYS